MQIEHPDDEYGLSFVIVEFNLRAQLAELRGTQPPDWKTYPSIQVKQADPGAVQVAQPY